MLREARARYPDLDFREGSMPELHLPDGMVAGAVLFYSIIHLTAPQRVAAFVDLARALRPGGLVLVAFHVADTDTQVHADEWFGELVSLDGYLLPAATVSAELTAGGLRVEASVERAAYPEVEGVGRRGYLLARKSGSA